MTLSPKTGAVVTLQTMTMAASMAAWLQIGCVRMIAHLIRALRDVE